MGPIDQVKQRIEQLNRGQKAHDTKWDSRFLDLAKLVSTWSKDPSTQTGAVIVDAQRRIVSVGYNGFPTGMSDTDLRYLDREFKYANIVHCERNAIIFAQRPLHGCTLYTFPFMSCSVCAGMVVQSGIKNCVAPYSDNPRWVDSFKMTRDMFRQCGVELHEIDYL